MNPKFENKIGIKVPELMMPSKNVDLTKWACVACDQYTSQPDSWNKCEEIVGDAPSTLRLMLPEIYLEKEGEAERIAAIRKTMDEYVEKGILESKGEGFVFTRRTVKDVEKICVRNRDVSVRKRRVGRVRDGEVLFAAFGKEQYRSALLRVRLGRRRAKNARAESKRCDQRKQY